MTPALDCFALSTGTFVVRRGRVRREDGKSYSVEWMLGLSISFLYFLQKVDDNIFKMLLPNFNQTFYMLCPQRRVSAQYTKS
jgi:hypothetical protein